LGLEQRDASKTAIASSVQPCNKRKESQQGEQERREAMEERTMLEPSATMRTPALIKASASSFETSFWVAPGRAI